MAISSPRVLTDGFGEQYTFYVDAADVKFVTSLRETPITAFAQAVEDSPVDVDQDGAGILTVTYLDADGNRLSKASDRDGDAGTWS